jgi:hypothetical protein
MSLSALSHGRRRSVPRPLVLAGLYAGVTLTAVLVVAGLALGLGLSYAQAALAVGCGGIVAGVAALRRSRVTAAVAAPTGVSPWSAAATVGAPGKPVDRGLRWERSLSWVLPLVAYLIVAWILDFHFYDFIGDSVSRMANAYYVFYSRDPHLASLGFVWNPLTSVSSMPFILFKNVWSGLTVNDYAGSLQSSLYMAAAVYHVRGFLQDVRVNRPTRLVLTGLFAIDPMVVFYGANGMSEASFVFTLVVAARYLCRWMETGGSRPLVIAGTFVGLAYATRNEAAASAACSTLVVFGVAWLRSRAPRRRRLYTALTDAVVYALPITACFVGWAVAAWVIVGSPFSQIQGSAGQVAAEQQGGKPTLALLAHQSFASIGAQAPLLVPLLLLALYLGWRRRRDFMAVAPASLFGGLLVFQIAAHLDDLTANSFRYYIMSIPCVVFLAGLCLRPRPRPRPRPAALPAARAGEAGVEPAAAQLRADLPADKRWRAHATDMVLSLVASLAVLVGVITVAHTMLYSPATAPQETEALSWLFNPQTKIKLAASDRKAWDAHRSNFQGLRQMSAQIDAMHLPRGDIITDNSLLCVYSVLVFTEHPKQYVIANDEDWQRDIEAPLTFNVHYALVADYHGPNGLSLIFSYDPTLKDPPPSYATLVRKWDISNCGPMYLYKFVTPPKSSGG